MTEKSNNNEILSNQSGELVAALDSTDRDIMRLLRQDGRMPYRALASEVQVSEAKVRARVRKLEDSDTMRVVAVTDFEAVGYTMMLAVGVQVQGRNVSEVVAELADVDEIFSACQVVGATDIELLIVAENQKKLTRFLSLELSQVPGVFRVKPALAIDVIKNQPTWVPFRNNIDNDHDHLQNVLNVSTRQIDEVDINILEWLYRDARISNRKIAAELGITEGTVRLRIKRMVEQGKIRITAINNISHLRNPALAYLWIDVERSDQLHSVARQLAKVPEAGFVGIIMGRADILVITMVKNNVQLALFLQSKVNTIPGVRNTECSLGVDFVKHDYRMSRIVGSNILEEDSQG